MKDFSEKQLKIILSLMSVFLIFFALQYLIVKQNNASVCLAYCNVSFNTTQYETGFFGSCACYYTPLDIANFDSDLNLSLNFSK